VDQAFCAYFYSHKSFSWTKHLAPILTLYSNLVDQAL
jgi:hypothetical protein